MTRWTVYDGRGSEYGTYSRYWVARFRQRLLDPRGLFTHLWKRPSVSVEEIRRTVKITDEWRGW